MLHSSSTLQNIWINRASHNVMAAGWGAAGRVREYFTLRKQNDILAGRNFELFKELQHYKELERSMKAMAKLDSAGLPPRFNYIPAEITAMGTNTRHNYIIVDKGSDAGVRPGCAIVMPNGVAGMIYAVDKHYSYGLSLMNDRINVSARIGREGLVAPLRWDGRRTDHATLRDIPLHLEIPVGDTVWTSGISKVYPPDIPMGITEGVHMEDGAVRVVDVRLFVDFASLRYVILAENPDRDIIEELSR
ncbi:MAG: rod shape-determining protein MreC [Bacteroidales bacterium]|nr:rod shape-determining protein MreC [Bacteroidales bacterium]